MDSSLEYACKRLQELESLLLVDVPETVWPAEVSMVFAQIEKAGTLPAHHINRMWLEKMPVPSIIGAARLLARTTYTSKKVCKKLCSNSKSV
ncbi:TPA: hypothetical protein ACRI62_005744 [Klebsiella michiganensis]